MKKPAYILLTIIAVVSNSLQAMSQEKDDSNKIKIFINYQVEKANSTSRFNPFNPYASNQSKCTSRCNRCGNKARKAFESYAEYIKKNENLYK